MKIETFTTLKWMDEKAGISRTYHLLFAVNLITLRLEHIKIVSITYLQIIFHSSGNSSDHRSLFIGSQVILYYLFSHLLFMCARDNNQQSAIYITQKDTS